MYSAVIILAFISITYAVPLHSNNEVNKSTKVQSSANELVAVNSPAYYPTQNNHLANFPSDQTYPMYVENKNNNKQDNINPDTAVVQTTAPLAVAQTTAPLENIVDLLPIGTRIMLFSRQIGIYLLRHISVIIVGIGAFSMLCTYTSICNLIYPKGNTEVQELARMYMTPEILSDLTSRISKAFDLYNSSQ